jgi:exodeoxyribonuclease VII large subunit
MAYRDLFETQEENDQVLSVSELTDRIKDLLEGSFPSVWVAGEISNFSRPQSGHCYLTLKDDRAQLRAVIWRSTAARVRFDLEDGLEVICRGQIDLYAPRGTYQLVIQEIQPKGIGALELALRKLREKLAAEGLFEPARKRPLPRFPRRIAVVTSPTGAAIRDFLEVLRRRWRGVEVLIVPVRVQGEGAGAEIAAAVALVNRLATPIHVIVVTRGGGSLEDLWAFNEEVVVRAIFASRIPVVSGVGHEIDVTLADLVADVRALTPSEAAERIAPAAEEMTSLLRQGAGRLSAALRSRAAAARSRLETIASRRVFRKPLERVHELARRLDELSLRSNRAAKQRWLDARTRLDRAASQLESLSPLAVLGRGYSLTHRVRDGALVRDAADLNAGELIETRFARGRAASRVEELSGD